MRSRLDPLTIAAITVAIIAVSSSGPLIAYAAAPALAIAFWRNALAVGVLAPVTLTRRRAELRGLRARPRLALERAGRGRAGRRTSRTWVPSVKMTTVATATALVATQPVWAGLIALWQGRRLGRLTWVGIGSRGGGRGDRHRRRLRPSGRAVARRPARRGRRPARGGLHLPRREGPGQRPGPPRTPPSATPCAPRCCCGVCLIFGVQLTGFDDRTWLAILALTVGAQLLGHSMFNYALHKVSATTISVLILLEVPGAAAARLGLAGPGPARRRLARHGPAHGRCGRRHPGRAPPGRPADPRPRRRRPPHRRAR